MDEPRPHIKVMENGPYRVSGIDLVRMRPVKGPEGFRVDWQRGPELEHQETFDLCRCGQSATKPFCDGTEQTIDFDGTETADRGPTVGRRDWYGDGPVVVSDDRSLCSSARFCIRGDIDVWNLAENTADPDRRALLVRMVERCPSGRLAYHVAPDRAPREQTLAQEIGVIDDGPLWIRGGIPVEAADGFVYEVRNRATLCRCGQSSNKPFCDGSHRKVGFRDS